MTHINNMNRRNFIKGSIATAAATMLNPMSAFAKANYITYNSRVCNTLSGLRDYRTNAPFQQSSFAIAYFSTPYRSYPGDGCDEDLISIFKSKTAAEFRANVDITPVLVLSPRGANDPAPDFADKFTASSFKGITGTKQQIIETARNYRAPFEIDRFSKEIIGHQRFAILISPKGELIAKYMPNHLDRMSNDLINHINNYTESEIRNISCP